MNEQKNKKLFSAKNIIIVLATLLVIVAAAFAVINFFPLGSSNGAQSAPEVQQAEQTQIGFTAPVGKEGGGFPVAFSSNNIKAIGVVGVNVYVVSNEMLFCISPSGRLIFSSVINYAKPVLKVNGRYAILFDRLSGKYLLLSDKKIMLSSQTDETRQIITACVCDNGSYVIAFRGGDAAGVVNYYKKDGTKLYAWSCVKDQIVSLDVCQSKKNIAVAALSAEDGEIATKVYFLNTFSDDTTWEYTLKDSAAIDISFSSLTEKLVVLCHNRRVLLNWKSDEPIVSSNEYVSNLLSSCSDESGNSVTVTAKFDSFDSFEIINYDSDNNITYTYECEEKVVAVDCKGKKTYILTPTAIISLNSFGKESSEIKLDAASLGFDAANNHIYHYSIGYLYKD